MQMNVNSNFKQLNRSLDDIGRRQLPFAYSKTINDTMFAVRKHVVEKTYPKSFEQRNKRFFNAILRPKYSKKNDLHARIFDAVGREYLERHTKGGLKVGRGNIAIPSTQTKSLRGATGRIPKRLAPRKLVDTPRGFIGKVRNQPAILQRASKKKPYPIKVVYLLEKTARIKKSFPFYEDAFRITRNMMPRFFKTNFNNAMRTRKR